MPVSCERSLSSVSVDGQQRSEIIFGKITDPLDSKIRKMLVRDLYGNEIGSSVLAHDIFAIEIQIRFLKLVIVLNES